jgi:hypothetical protein
VVFCNPWAVVLVGRRLPYCLEQREFTAQKIACCLIYALTGKVGASLFFYSGLPLVLNREKNLTSTLRSLALSKTNQQVKRMQVMPISRPRRGAPLAAHSPRTMLRGIAVSARCHLRRRICREPHSPNKRIPIIPDLDPDKCTNRPSKVLLHISGNPTIRPSEWSLAFGRRA